MVGDPSDIQPGIKIYQILSRCHLSSLPADSLNISYPHLPQITEIIMSISKKKELMIMARQYFQEDVFFKLSQVCNAGYLSKMGTDIRSELLFCPFRQDIYGTDLSLKTSFYFPGIFPNNGIKLRFEKEKQDPAKYLYCKQDLFSAGYKNIISKDIDFLSVDYVLPLVYPDFNISSLLYLKRITHRFFL